MDAYDTLVELREHSCLHDSILKEVKDSLLSPASFRFQPVKIELIINTVLADEFITVKKEYELNSEEEYEHTEKFAFLSVSENDVAEICRSGYICRESSFNILGLSKYGVYLCKHADVCINEAHSRRSEHDSSSYSLIMFKYVPGKQTTALVRKGPKILPISPTQNFNSHCSVIAPKDFDDLETQFDRSQIYFYEFKGKAPVSRPRQCIPYAVITLLQISVGSGSFLWQSLNFTKLCILHPDALRSLAQTDDESVMARLKDDYVLKDYVNRARERTYEELKPNVAEPQYKKSVVAVQNSTKSTYRSTYNVPYYSVPRVVSIPNYNNLNYMVYRAQNGLTYAVQSPSVPSYILQTPTYLAPTAPGIPGAFYRLPLSPLLPQQQIPYQYAIIAPPQSPFTFATPRSLSSFPHQQMFANGPLQLAPATHYIQNLNEFPQQQQPPQMPPNEESSCQPVQEYCVPHNYPGATQLIPTQPSLPQGYVFAHNNSSCVPSQDVCVNGPHELALNRPTPVPPVQPGAYQMLNLSSPQPNTGIQSSFPGNHLTVPLTPAQAAAASNLVQHTKSIHSVRHHPYAR